MGKNRGWRKEFGNAKRFVMHPAIDVPQAGGKEECGKKQLFSAQGLRIFLKVNKNKFHFYDVLDTKTRHPEPDDDDVFMQTICFFLVSSVSCLLNHPA
ncbi:hypothetical protein ACTVJH_13530 [Desulfoplanes sp. PS50]